MNSVNIQLSSSQSVRVAYFGTIHSFALCTGSGDNGRAKKNGCGGKYTWGSWEDALENYEDDLWEDEIMHMQDDAAEMRAEIMQQATRQVVKCTEANKARRVFGQRKAHKVNKRRVMIKARSTNTKARTPVMMMSAMPQPSHISFGVGFKNALHKSADDEMDTPSFLEEVQTLVCLMGPHFRKMSHDTGELYSKQLMSKVQAKKRFNHHPRAMTRNGSSVCQPVPATRCH
eukprot:CAMPEP_0114265316 /NCGR_PEP_ID=MMETSP0058-20121206/23823_1 /TAXON_ID=36894 /ORGANISM="Pyramimonas parkeae, CCMP726" /LENGTH=229 /DNA_ID=CAMNT_0001382345 /DNA_START=388 /DNA_END=1077 /DNA_ORIENTATION=-